MIQPVSQSGSNDQESLAQAAPVAHLRIDSPMAGMRLDKALAQLLPDHSRARIQGWIQDGHVKVNDRIEQRVRHGVAPGDHIAVQMQPDQQSQAYEPQPIRFPVVHETAHWLVLDKPAGLVVHPGAGNWQGTLLNGLLHRYPAIATVARAGIVHRLDKDTSGLMVVAKNEIAQTHLVRQLQERTVKRQYRALVHGWLPDQSLTIDRAIGRDPRVPVRMSVLAHGPAKPALTTVTCLRRGTLAGAPVSEVVCQLHTGRTHQIRVHMASIQHPLVGDPLYGGKPLAGAARQMLHAQHLSFIDPLTQSSVQFDSPMPADMLLLWQQVQWTDEVGAP
jgi:23S rRNA pseudouridine1911/1915/1917 synthase